MEDDTPDQRFVRYLAMVTHPLESNPTVFLVTRPTVPGRGPPETQPVPVTVHRYNPGLVLTGHGRDPRLEGTPTQKTFAPTVINL